MSIMDNVNKDITGPELDRPMESPQYEPFEDLPNREWLRAIIVDVKFQRVIFNGVIQYQYRENDVNGIKVKEVVLDEVTKLPKEQRAYNIEYALLDHKTPTGKFRKAWAGFGGSLGKKAKFNTYLAQIGAPNVDAITPQPSPNEIIKFLKNKHVYIQFKMVTDQKTGELKQKIDKDAIKLADKPHEYLIDQPVAAPTPQPAANPFAAQQPAPAATPAPVQNPFAGFAPTPQPAATPAADAPIVGWDD